MVVKCHQTVKRVTEGMEELRYNTSIAALMELVNALRADNCTQRTMVEDLVVMLAPFAPHFAEESWERLGHATSVFDARWPTWDEGLTVEDSVEVVVQVNGKTRSRVTVPRDAEQGAVVEAAQRDAAVRRFTEGKEVRKVVYVPNRLLNLVVGYRGRQSGPPLRRASLRRVQAGSGGRLSALAVRPPEHTAPVSSHTNESHPDTRGLRHINMACRSHS